MNFKLRIVALLLLVMMVFTSCSLDSIMQFIPGMGGDVEESTTTTPTSTTKKPTTTTKPTGTTNPPVDDTPVFDVTKNSLSYDELLARYDLTQDEVDEAIALLDDMVDISLTATDVEDVNVVYAEFEKAYYHITQQMTISMILYYYDMIDEEATKRYLDTTDMYYALQDKYNQACKDMLKSPIADQIFKDWSEEEIEALKDYDPAVMELKKEIDELQVQYDQLLQSDPEYNAKTVEIYKQLIVKNNQLAKMNKYENYYDYAAANVYGRDYKREDLANFREYIIEYVVPSCDKVINDYDAHENWESSTKKGRLEEFLNKPFYTNAKRNYLIPYLESLEGTMGENMRDVFESRNCIFSYQGNSHPTAFQTYLYEDGKPFCFFGSKGQSASTVVHEIGHYYAAKTNPDIDNYDLCETHSQGNEFLFLTYCQQHLSEDIFKAARAAMLEDACYVMVLATIIDEFEQRVYLLDDETIQSMTGVDFDNIMTDVCEPYGGASWVGGAFANPYAYWRLVTISNPVYYISYAVSATAAVNILAMAEEDYDAAIVAYTSLVEGVTYEDGFLGALAKAGLTTPFEEETFIKIEEVLTK